MLGSTFHEQRAALAALGFEADSLPDRGSAPASFSGDGAESVQFTDEGRLRIRLDELRRQVGRLPAGPIPRNALAGIPLEGWWEVGGANDRRFLPVMTNDVRLLDLFASSVATCVRDGIPMGNVVGTTWLSSERLVDFATVARRVQQTPRWVPISSATAAQVGEVVAAVLAPPQHPAPTAEIPPQMSLGRNWYSLGAKIEAIEAAG